jgi:hypothetical protein
MPCTLGFSAERLAAPKLIQEEAALGQARSIIARSEMEPCESWA